MEKIIKFADTCNVLTNNERVVLANISTGKWIKISKECFDILKKAEKSFISENQLIETLADDEDKEYFRKLIAILDSLGVLVRENPPHKKNSSIFYFDITHRCNLSCIHCSANAADINEKEYLSTDNIKTILSKVVDCNPETITLSGGEPLIRPDFFEILSYLKSIYKNKIILMTNGIMINKKNVKALVDNIHIFNISIDGADEESCSSIRGKGIYSKVIKSVELLKLNGAKNISLSMVDVASTHDFIDKFFDLNKELGTQPMLRHISFEGRALSNKKVLTNNNQFNDMHTYGKIKEINTSDKDKRYTFECTTCQAGQNVFNIDAKGDIYPCTCLRTKDYYLGNVLTIDSLKDYISGEIKERDEFKNLGNLKAYNYGDCKDCNVNIFCWTCPYYLKEYHNRPDFKNICKLQKSVLSSIWEEEK